jgi:hypothetical protein
MKEPHLESVGLHDRPAADFFDARQTTSEHNAELGIMFRCYSGPKIDAISSSIIAALQDSLKRLIAPQRDRPSWVWPGAVSPLVEKNVRIWFVAGIQ